MTEVSGGEPSPEERIPYRFPDITPEDNSPSHLDDHERDGGSWDIQPLPLALGCGASCLINGVVAIVVLAILASAGTDPATGQIASVPAFAIFVAVIGGAGSEFAVGYVAAYAATCAPRLHAVLLGIAIMLFCAVDMALPAPPSVASVKLAVVGLHLILAIPLVLLGASVAMRRRETA